MGFTTGKPEMGGGISEPLPKGDYPFEVVDLKWKVSEKSGADMIELKIRCEGEGREVLVWDFLVFSANAFWKFDQFLKTIDKHPGEGVDVDVVDGDEGKQLFVNGKVWEIDDFISQRGNVTLKVGKNNKGEPRNEVVGFIWEEF